MLLYMYIHGVKCIGPVFRPYTRGGLLKIVIDSIFGI